eukprot:gene5695-7725_t
MVQQPQLATENLNVFSTLPVTGTFAENPGSPARLSAKPQSFQQARPGLTGHFAGLTTDLATDGLRSNLQFKGRSSIAASAWSDMSLTGADLSKVVASTIAAWRESDERHDDRLVLVNGRTLGSARENVLMFVELAETALEAHASGTSLHDGPYVESRFSAAGLESPSDKEGLHRAGRGLTLGLATYYLGAAIELADRHDLGRGLRGLPVERWRAHHGKLLQQLLGERTLGLHPVTSQAPVPASATGVALPAAERSADQALYAGDVSLLGGSDQLFSTLIVESLERRITSRELAKSALQDAQSTIRIWTEVCGDR